MQSVFSSLVLWRSVVAAASLPRGQFAWRPVYGGQLSRGQLSCTALSNNLIAFCKKYHLIDRIKLLMCRFITTKMHHAYILKAIH